MRVILEDTSRSPFVALRDAMLCIDCEFVTPGGSGRCSICDGHRLVVLADLLGLLVEQACGSKSPTRLAELASVLACKDAGQASRTQN
jgi:hypothetical protein